MSDIAVLGGFAGTRARTEDLERCAETLRSAARHLETASWVLRRLQDRLLSLASSPGADPVLASLARTARLRVEPLGTGSASLMSLLQLAARDVDTARRGYEEAERSACRWVGALDCAVPLPSLQLVVRQAASFLRDLALPGTQLPGPEAVPFLAGSSAFLVDLVLGRRRGDVEAVPREAGLAPVPRSVRDLAERHRRTALASGEVGVLVEKVHRADGGTAWVVTIPGTQDWGVTGEHAMDLRANLGLVGGASATSLDAVRAAMRRAGVRPEDPVVLNGHSQGGLVAQRLAQTGEFDVRAVVTFGSPVGAPTTRTRVPSLHLEHTDDVVPQLDGADNPADATTTTVRARSPEGSAGPVEAHLMDGYAETAAEVDALGHASVEHVMEAVEEALGGGRAAYGGTWVPTTA